jgi:hypothetical protein
LCEYNGGNVLKGGVFTQCGGWLGTHELWGGNVSDSDYNRNAGYLEEQAAFQQNDLCDGELLRFTNVHDKGYQARAICWDMVNLLRSPSLGGVTNASLAVIQFTRHQLHQIGLAMSEQ